MTATTDAARDEAARVVRHAIRTILPAVPAAELRGERHLRDLGADSVERVEIILAVIQRLRLDVPMSSFSGLPSIDALVEHAARAPRR